MKIEQLISKFAKLDMTNVIEKSLNKIKPDIDEYQRIQMLEGKRRDGKQIGKYKSLGYAKYKFSLNAIAGFRNVDLKLTGALHKKIFAEIKSGSVVIFSRDKKAPMLTKTYSPDIWGLNRDARTALSINKLKPVAQQIILQNIS